MSVLFLVSHELLHHLVPRAGEADQAASGDGSERTVTRDNGCGSTKTGARTSRRSHLHVNRAEGDGVGFEQLDLLARGEAGSVLADDVTVDAMASKIVGKRGSESIIVGKSMDTVPRLRVGLVCRLSSSAGLLRLGWACSDSVQRFRLSLAIKVAQPN